MIHTELEHCVLGVIWRRGPCSAYLVCGVFADSPSAYWSASAGSIYPVVERLIAAGLVAAKADAAGGRSRRMLEVTADGEEALRRWLARMDRETSSATYDPVRTRLAFLDIMPPGSRRALIAAAIEETQARLAELERHERQEREAGKRWEALATLGAHHELRSRIDWLREIASEVEE